VKGGDQILKASWNEWLASSPGEPLILNGDELAVAAKIPIQTWRDGGFSLWSWLPTIATEVGVLGPDPSSVRVVQKTTAAMTIVQATDGIPLQIWLAHEGAVPDSVAPALKGSNPWNLKSEQVPWIEEVKFIEIKLRPGNAIAIPTHWWWAARAMLPAIAEKPTMADGAWYWIATPQNPVSLLVSKVLNKK
jgi:hypothetical protein